MRIREPNPFRCHAIKSRGLVSRFGIVTGQIAEAEIVGIDDDDVWMVFSLARDGHRQKQDDPAQSQTDHADSI